MIVSLYYFTNDYTSIPAQESCLHLSTYLLCRSHLKNMIRLLDSIYFSLCLTIRHLFVSQSAGFCVVKKHYALLTNVHENVYAVPEAICLLLIDDLYHGEE